MSRTTAFHRAAGAGLIEILVAVTLAVLVLGGVIQSTNRGLGAFRAGAANNDVESRAARAMSRLVRELLGAGAQNVQPDLSTPVGAPTSWSSSIDFRVGAEWQAGAIVWSEPRRLAWELAPGEQDNDLDDNGDGLADEGALVFLENPGTADERRVVLANGVREFLEGEQPNGLDDNGNGLVDEQGLAFDLAGQVLSVRFSLERIGPDRRPILRTQETSIRLRNSGA